MQFRFAFLGLFLAAAAVSMAAESSNEGFEPLFDGKSLKGWETPDPSYWSIEDDAITAKITPEHPCTVNQYLIWEGGTLGDFELKLTFRMISDEPVNGGFQFRSRIIEGHDVAGYQVDNDTREPWLVRLYDEFGRHTLALRGQRTLFDKAGVAMTTDIPSAQGEPKFKLSEWHEYHLICKGTVLTLKVNGELMAEVEDHDPNHQDLYGLLGLQLHSGPPMTVQFKNILLKRLDEKPLK